MQEALTQPDLMTPHDVAQADGEVCSATVRYWERTGKLPAALRTASGMRLFHRADVERVLTARRAARQSRPSGDGR